jgi:hypothetical protein
LRAIATSSIPHVEGQAAKVVLVCTGVNLSDIERCKAGIVYAFRVGIPVILVEFTAAYVCVCFAYFMVGHHGNRGENGGSLLCCLERLFAKKRLIVDLRNCDLGCDLGFLTCAFAPPPP